MRFNRIDKLVLASSAIGKFFITLGGATAYAEGHPYLAALFIALGLGLIELKDQATKKQNPRQNDEG